MERDGISSYFSRLSVHLLAICPVEAIPRPATTRNTMNQHRATEELISKRPNTRLTNSAPRSQEYNSIEHLYKPGSKRRRLLDHTGAQRNIPSSRVNEAMG